MHLFIKDGHTVSFYDDEPDQHLYLYDGKEVPSVTQSLILTGIKGSVPMTDFIRQRADFGNLVHNEIDCYEKTGKMPLTSEGRFWVRYGHPLCDRWETEVMFGTPLYAGRCDAIGHNADGSIVLLDHKTGKVDEDIVSWQLSLYWHGLAEFGVIDGNVPVRLICYDAKGDDGCFIDIQRKSDEELELFFDALRNGTRYIGPSMLVDIPTEPLTTEEMDTLKALLAKVPKTEMYAIIKDLAKEVRKTDSDIKAQMIAQGQTKAMTKDGHLWTLTEYTEHKFSEDLMKKLYPKLGPRILERCKAEKAIQRFEYKGNIHDKT